MLTILAKMCHYAQEHICCSDAWSMKQEQRKNRLQCTSYAVACFLAQNTLKGSLGVEWDIVINELCDASNVDENGEVYKTIEEWEEILQPIVDDLGGWR